MEYRQLGNAGVRVSILGLGANRFGSKDVPQSEVDRIIDAAVDCWGGGVIPSEPAPGFGTSVAIDDYMIIVGAPKVDIEGAPAGAATADGHTAGGAAYVFVPGVGRYVPVRKLRPRPDELFQYQDFGYRVAMFGPRVVVGAAKPYVPNGFFPFGLAVAYARDGTSLLQYGVAQGHVVAASMSLVNNWLLLGVPYEKSCPSGCTGSAHIYDVNRLPQ